jgi:hypothetical protein
MSTKRGLIALLLLCLVGIGCLKNQGTTTTQDTQDLFSGADTPAPIPAPDYSTDEPATAPQPAAAKQPATALADRYTGAVVYTDPANCLPCVFLESDLHALERRGWTVCWWGSEDFTGTEDWILSPAGKRYDKVPTVDYFVDGKIVDTHQGYSTASNRNDRRDALAEIVQKHPAAAD